MIREMIDLSKYSRELMLKPNTLSQRIITDWGIPSDDAAVMIYVELVKGKL